MSVIDTNFLDDSGLEPHAVSIVLDSAAGNDRAVVVVVMISDQNPAANYCDFDPSGIDAPMTELFDLVELSTGTSQSISAWYILDADLPSGSGTFDIEVGHTLALNGVGVAVYSLEGVEQSAPTSNTGEALATVNPSISTGAASTDTVIDVWNGLGFATYTADGGQTEVFVESVFNNKGLSSYRTGSGDMGWTNDNTISRDHVGGYIIFPEAGAGGGTILPFIQTYYRGLN